MLKHHNSSAIVAVSDLARAGGVNSDVLGLELDESGGEEGVLQPPRRGWWFKSQEAGHKRAKAVV